MRAYKRLLIVEDELLVAMSLAKDAERMGCTADTVDNADAAVRFVERCAVDLVVLDVRLRGEASGLEAARRLRAVSEVPIAFMSAYIDDTIVAEMRSIPNVVEILSKPISDDAFTRLIRG